MKRLKLLCIILKRSKVLEIILSFLGYILIFALIIKFVEPEIDTYGDALWYCYSVMFTVGFGDIIVTTAIAKILSVIITIFATFVIAIATGVVVSFYKEIGDLQKNKALSLYLDKLEHLSELSHEELEEMSKQIRKFR